MFLHRSIDIYRSLLSKLQSNHIFADVVGRRIIPLILTPIVLAEQSAVTYVIKDILTPFDKQNGMSKSGM